jgi:hypothetical protein
MRKLTRSVTTKLTETDYHRLLTLADRDRKRLGEWCRDKLLELLERPSVDPSARALMAEIAATQNIAVTMLYELANGMKLSRERVQAILNGAHAAKFGDADERMKLALSETATPGRVATRTRV